MDNDVYVVLKDMSSYEGEGYSSSSYNELMCIASDFNIILEKKKLNNL